MGPTGPTGPQGPQGSPGVTGPAGGVGNATGIVFGDSAPTMGVTNVSDVIYQLKAALAPGSTAPGAATFAINTISRTHYVPGVAGRQVSNATGFVGIGALVFDPRDYVPGIQGYAQHVKFQAVLQSASGVTATLQLYNLSVGTGVSGSQVYSSQSVPTYVVSPDLSLPSSRQIYEVQLAIAGMTSADQATVDMAGLEISHG